MNALEKVNAALPDGAQVEILDSREAWLEKRRANIREGYIGSTTAAAMLGLSRFSGPWDVWANRWDEYGAEPVQTEEDNSGVLSRGLAMEPMLLEAYAKDFGAEVLDPGHLRVIRGKFAVSPDALANCAELGWGVIETKTVMLSQAQWVPREHIQVDGLDGLTRWPMPREYLVQCLVMCCATGLPFCDLWVAVVIEVDDDRCAIATEEFPFARPHAVVRRVRIRVIPSAEDLALFKTALAEFYAAHLAAPGNPPPLDDSRACYLHQLGEDPASRKTKREATEQEAEIIAEILKEGDAEKAAKAEKNTSRAHLVQKMAGMKSVWVKTTGGKRITATISTRGVLKITEPKA